jgi:hypothetical protein
VNKMTTIFRIAIPTCLVVFFTAFFIIFSSQAASLTSVYVYFSRIKGGLTGVGAQSVEFVLAVAPTQSMSSGGTVKIEFPDTGDGFWCREAGALVVAAVDSSQADLVSTNWDIDAELTNSGTPLEATCTKGSGGGSADTILITNVGALTGGTTYGVHIKSDTGVIGTNSAGQHELTVTVASGATIDSKTFRISLIADDSVVVSATVSDAPSVTCSISSNTVNLGTLYPGGAYAVGSHTVGTQATIGYYWAAYGTGNGSSGDAGLYKTAGPTHLIASGPNPTIDLTVPGSEGFGLTVSDPDAGDPATVATNFVNTTPGTFGTLDRTYTGAKLLLYQNGAQGSTENSTITYGARAGASAPAGTYQ